MIDQDKYNEFKKNQGPIIDEDFEIRVVDDVLTEENIKDLYKIIEQSESTVQAWGGRKSWNLMVDKHMYQRLNQVIRDKIGITLILKEYFFIRYNPKYGYIPKLFPHYDDRVSQRVTIDIQLNSNQDWGVVVEGKETVLKYNQGLIFAGTQQQHWREHIDLREDAEIDMLVCNFSYLPDRPLQENHFKMQDERSNFLIDLTGIGNKDEKYSS
jgi:hypothetical protein